ncbi:MAG: hypothetical protein Q4C04_01505 [Clostridia bacterium]|nr:hypothetical protein [Clostridia bacterium]
MKKTTAFLLVACLALSMLAFAACGGGDTEPEADTYTVTYYDGETILRTAEVEAGATADDYVPTKDGGYEFVDWYSTPTKNHKFDFSQAITADTSIFAGFTLFEVDTRDYYVVGSGTSTLLISSNWGNNITDDHKLTKDETLNEYTITMDLLAGDEFQFAINSSWEAKRGYGYLTALTLEDGTEVFSGQGSPYDDSSKGANIKVELSGNYTFTLTTHPADDYYNTSASTYTEATKEIYNLSTYDTISWVRNGDPIVETVSLTEFYIKGAAITNWQDMINDTTKMAISGSTHTLSIFLNEGEEFMFASQVTAGTEVAAGSVFINYTNLDAASQEIISRVSETGTNMVANASGLYSFAYDAETTVLSATVDATAVLENRDYYLDGTYGGGTWGDYQSDLEGHIFAADAETTYKLENVELAAGDEIIIRSYAAGTENPGWSDYVDLTYAYLAANSAFEANGNNIKVLTAGSYDITINNYSKIVTIIEHGDSNDIYDIYIKGAGINDWEHGFAAEYAFTMNADGTAYEYIITVTDTIDFGMERHDQGSTSGYGTWLGTDSVGTDGDANALFLPESGSNYNCSTAGTYRIVYTVATEKVDFYVYENEDIGTAYVKGSAIESWGNQPASGMMATVGGKFELTLTMAVNDEIMIQYFEPGYSGDEWGAAFLAGNVADGGANANFDLTGNNIKCLTAGTYLIVFDPAAGTITITIAG